MLKGGEEERDGMRGKYDLDFLFVPHQSQRGSYPRCLQSATLIPHFHFVCGLDLSH